MITLDPNVPSAINFYLQSQYWHFNIRQFLKKKRKRKASRNKIYGWLVKVGKSIVFLIIDYLRKPEAIKKGITLQYKSLTNFKLIFLSCNIFNNSSAINCSEVFFDRSLPINKKKVHGADTSRWSTQDLPFFGCHGQLHHIIVLSKQPKVWTPWNSQKLKCPSSTAVNHSKQWFPSKESLSKQGSTVQQQIYLF